MRAEAERVGEGAARGSRRARALTNLQVWFSPSTISRLLSAHEIVLRDARTTARLAADAGDDGTNDLLHLGRHSPQRSRGHGDAVVHRRDARCGPRLALRRVPLGP